MQEEEVGKIKINKIIERDGYKIIYIKKSEYIIYDYFFENLNVKEGEEYDISKLEEIKNALNKTKICDYITSISRKKMMSCYDIKKKALKKFDNEKDIDEVMELLKKYKIIDDNLYIEAHKYVLDDDYYGKYYIIDFFKHKHIDDSLIKAIEFDEEFEIEKGRKYFEEIKNFYVSKNFVKQKKKIYDLMLRRGFGLEIINEVITNLKVDKNQELKLLEKDYKKAYEKLSNKYKDFELSNKIINHLVTKGYSYSDIVIEMNKENEKND